MKKLTLLLLTFFAVVLSANVFGQMIPIKNGGRVWTDITSPWNGKTSPQVVTIGSEYSYAVELNKTITLEGLKKKIADASYILHTDEAIDNRYVWELFKVDVDDNDVPTKYTIISKDDFTGKFDRGARNYQKYTWPTATKLKPYYLIRVSEYPDHDLDATNVTSLEADKKSISVSEFFVKIGDRSVIVIPTGPDAKSINQDGYLCDVDATTAKDFDDLSSFSPTTFLCNALPIVKDPAVPTSLDGFSVVLNVTQTTASPLSWGASPQQITINVPLAKLEDPNLLMVTDPTTGLPKRLDLGVIPTEYYALRISLESIAEELVNKKTRVPSTKLIDFDAKDFDIYYEITVAGYVHNGTDVTVNATTGMTDENVYYTKAPDRPSNFSGNTIALDNYKVTRVCGIYTTPKITKIQFRN
ncbi:MAG: hypothetical protein WBG43_11415 [Marinifilaceae bacterium]